jgi:hypothetical protein
MGKAPRVRASTFVLESTMTLDDSDRTRSVDVPSTRHPDAPRGAAQSLGVAAGFDPSTSTRLEEIATAELGGLVEDSRLVSGLGPWVQLSAREPGSQEHVALWIRARSRLSEPATREVLEAAKRLRSAPSPSVVPVHRFGCTDELLWLMGTEYAGSPLSEWFGDRSAHSVEGAKTFLDLALPALQAIHEVGLVHGALSAESFHRDADGVIRVCRPGIDVPILRADLAAGTPSGAATCAPPEVRAGDEPMAASDQYALAAAIVRMLTGRAPEPDGQDMPREVPMSWRPILQRALASVPARRHRDLGGFWTALRSAPVTQAGTARPRPMASPPRTRAAASPSLARPVPAALSDSGPVLFPDSWDAPLAPDEWSAADTTPARRALGLMVLLISLATLVVLYDGNAGVLLPVSKSLVGVWADEGATRAGFVTPPATKAVAPASEDREDRPVEAPVPTSTRDRAEAPAVAPAPAPARPAPAETQSRTTATTDAAAPAATRTRAPARAIAPIRASRPDPAPETPPTPPPAPGTLSMQTYPWGAVYIDGRYVGTTPLVDLVVPAGPHQIRVERDGQPAYVREVTVLPGQALRLTGIVLGEPGR